MAVLAGGIIPATEINNKVAFGLAAQFGWKIAAGTTAWNIATAAAAINVTISYGMTFSAAPVVVVTVRTGSNFEYLADFQGTPGVSSAGVRLFERAATSRTASGDLHWIAVGPA